MAQALENFAGHARISSLAFDRGFLDGRFWWWVQQQAITVCGGVEPPLFLRGPEAYLPAEGFLSRLGESKSEGNRPDATKFQGHLRGLEVP